jgi:hypothetical protein
MRQGPVWVIVAVHSGFKDRSSGDGVANADALSCGEVRTVESGLEETMGSDAAVGQEGSTTASMAKTIQMQFISA